MARIYHPDGANPDPGPADWNAAAVIMREQGDPKGKGMRPAHVTPGEWLSKVVAAGRSR